MKKFLKPFLAGVASACLVLAAIAASINAIQPVPQQWAIPNGTNAFTLSSDAVPGLRIQGTNWTGQTQTITGTNGIHYVFMRGFLVTTN